MVSSQVLELILGNPHAQKDLARGQLWDEIDEVVRAGLIFAQCIPFWSNANVVTASRPQMQEIHTLYLPHQTLM